MLNIAQNAKQVKWGGVAGKVISGEPSASHVVFDSHLPQSPSHFLKWEIKADKSQLKSGVHYYCSFLTGKKGNFSSFLAGIKFVFLPLQGPCTFQVTGLVTKTCSECIVSCHKTEWILAFNFISYWVYNIWKVHWCFQTFACTILFWVADWWESPVF